MLVGQVLQERYHLVARVHGNADRDTYVALDKSALSTGDNAQVQYILKHFHSPAEHGGQMLEKRLQTAARIRQLNHLSPQMPQLLQYWLEEDQFFVAYEYIDSQNLLGEISSQTEHQVMSLLAEIMEILQPLHQQQIAHGNLHPAQLSRRMAEGSIPRQNPEHSQPTPLGDPDPHQRQLILTDVGSLAFTDRQTLGEPHLLDVDMQALGQLAIHSLSRIGEPPEAWRSHTTPQFLALIDQLCAERPPTLMDAWIDLGKLMHQVLANAPAPTTDPDPITIHAQIDRHLLQGNPKGAIEECTKLIALEPKPLHFHNRGIIYSQELHNYQRAIQDFDMALSLKPDLAHAYKNRAYAHWQLGHLVEAIADYDQSLEHLPNLALVYWERALVHQEIGNIPAALADLNRFLTYNPYHGEAYLRRGTLRELQGDLALAVADYDQAIAYHPAVAAAYFQRGNLRASQQEYTLAIADYSQSLALDAQFAPAYQRRGAIYYQQGEVEKARYDYLQAIGLAPSAALYYQYGLMATDRRIALDSFDHALALEPHQAKIYCQRAAIFQQQGQLDRALADYDRAVEFAPESIEALCGRGVVRQKLKDYAGASSDYQRAANLYLDQGQQRDYERLLRVLESLPKAMF
jgi:tetratricopeptide (TPR) repeat protein